MSAWAFIQVIAWGGVCCGLFGTACEIAGLRADLEDVRRKVDCLGRHACDLDRETFNLAVEMNKRARSVLTINRN